MKWSPCDCKPGDMVRVRLGTIYHYGVYVSDERVIQFGLPPVPEYKTDGEIVVTASDIDVFSCGKIIEVAVLDGRERRKRKPPKETVSIAEKRIGEGGYNLLHNNCEHFAYECVFGIKYSEQEDAARKRWLQRGFFNIYIADIPENCDIGKVFNEKRNLETDRCGNSRLKTAKFLDWKLLEYAVFETFGFSAESVKFEKKHNGKWICDKFAFSLTHTDNTVAVAVSDEDCGIDAENISRANGLDEKTVNGMKKRAFTADETELSKNSVSEFLKIWTKKESIFKAYGTKSFFPKKTDTSSEKTTTVVFDNRDLILSYCGKSADKAKIKFVEYSNGVFREVTTEKTE